MKTLYEIKDDYLTLVSQIEDAEGEITPEMDEALTLNEKTLKAKSGNYIEFIGSRESLTDRIDGEIKRLQAMKTREKKLIDLLKSKLVEAVGMFGDIELGLKTITTRKSQAVECNLEDLSKEFKAIVVSEYPDKNKIKKAIKSGEEVRGASLVDKFNFRLK